MVKVLIDSKGRSSGTHADYAFNLQFPINNVRSMRLLYANFPQNAYTILAGFNDSIDFTYDSTLEVAVLTPGRTYDGNQLAAELQTQMDAVIAAPDFTVTYNPNTNKLSFVTAAEAWNFEIQTTTPNSRFIVGLSDPSVASASTALGVTFEMPNQVDTNREKYILLDVRTGNSGSNNLITVGNSHSFFIPLYKNFLELAPFDNLGQFLQSDLNANNPIREMRIRVVPAVIGEVYDPSGVSHQLLFEFL